VKNKAITKNSGLTLIEVLVAMSIFAVVISVAIGIFVSGSSSQRKILGINTAQREAGYLMEIISRELRMAKAIDSTQENLEDDIIEFTNYNSDPIIYCKANSSGDCVSGGKYLSRDGASISSSDIRIESIMFYVTEEFDGLPAGVKKQPIVTIVMKVRSMDGSDVKFTLQNSVSLRLY